MIRNRILPTWAILFALVLLDAASVLAHCDSMDGPVVKAAQNALATGNANHVLIWVRKQDEAEIIKAFDQTQAVRKLNPAAKELADMYFFETLVRIHRAGEGAPYTGLKPSGRDHGPAISAAEKALETGAAEPLLHLIDAALRNGMQKTLALALAKKQFATDEIAAGREYVKAYVAFIHYVERLYSAAQIPAEGHAHETNHGEAPPDEHE